MEGDTAAHLDDRIVSWVRELRTEPLTAAFRTVTHLADGWFVAIVVAFTAAVLVARRRPALGIAVVLASAGTAVITHTLKDLVGRDRPPPVTRLIEASGDALPSGHSAQAVACYGAIALVIAVTNANRLVRIAAVAGALTIALLVGVSRVYLGVHWPSDVVTGWIVGLSWLASVAAVAWLLWRLDRPPGWWGQPDRAHS
jgi:undecaprenyl-diphosphatase